MTQSISFSPTLLNNFDGLKEFFSGKEALKNLNDLPDSAFIQPKGGQLYFKWKIVWIVITYPFALITSIFFETLSQVLSCFYLESFFRGTELMAKHMLRDSRTLWNQCVYGKRLLMPTYSPQLLSNWDVYSQGNIKKDSIIEPRLKNLLWKKPEEIDFYQAGGVCRGATYWFNYLFLKASENTNLTDRSNSYADYARAIATQFEAGIPKQGALLQSLGGAEKKLLDIEQKVLVSYHPKDVINRSKSIINALSRLPQGTYLLGLQTHAISLIKYQGETLIWDSMRGLIKIENTDQLLDEITSHLRVDHKDPFLIVKQRLKPKSFSIFSRMFG